MNQTSTQALVPTTPSGSLSMLALLGASSGLIPLPFVPPRMLAQVRGTIAYSVARKHGVSLSRDARRILSTSAGQSPIRGEALGVVRWAVGRIANRLGPLAVVRPGLLALETFALGLLMDRYFDRVRKTSSIRLQPEEAHLVRRLIDRSIVQAASPTLHVPTIQRAEDPPGEDHRDDITRFVDWALMSASIVPAHLIARLETAFDHVVEAELAKTSDES